MRIRLKIIELTKQSSIALFWAPGDPYITRPGKKKKEN